MSDRGRINDGQGDFPRGPELLQPDMDGVTRGQTTGAIRRASDSGRRILASPTTDGQRRRLCRNLAIAAGAEAGLSQRELARIFDLPRSRVGEILKEMKEYACLS